MNEPEPELHYLIADAVGSLHEWFSSADVETTVGEPSPHMKIEVDEMGDFVLTVLRGANIVATVRDPVLSKAFQLLGKDLPPL